jgi:hypothetical protein
MRFWCRRSDLSEDDTGEVIADHHWHALRAVPFEGHIVSVTVCLAANALSYPKGGGHMWVYLNWALGLRALGCRVIWLERVVRHPDEVRPRIDTLKRNLERYGLAEHLALCSSHGEPLPDGVGEGHLDLEAAAEADLLLNMRYGMPPEIVERFRRSALVDIDPGLLQVWVSAGWINPAKHDMYFTIGETVGTQAARFPDCGLRWHYTPPPVFLQAWPQAFADSYSPYTTVSHWGESFMEYNGETIGTGKKTGFLDFFELPQRTRAQLELALCLGENEDWERRPLERLGWRIQQAWDVCSTPELYHGYIQRSRGEFSCAKPSCIQFNNAWISDRTLCYLASGKPAVVQHTGPSRFLPDADGLFRFRNLEEAIAALSATESDYERHSRLARELAEEHFDSQKVLFRVLERALP